MEKINVEIFKQEWNNILGVLTEIGKIPKLYGNGDRFSGVVIEDDGITYNTETFYSGCGTDTYSFSVKWDELNEPIEYFQKKFADEINKDEEIKKNRKELERARFEREEKEEYEMLKLKYEKK